MTVQIPGFCGIYFNEPVPLHIQLDFSDVNYQKKKLKRYGYVCGHVKNILKKFKSFKQYSVWLFPEDDDDIADYLRGKDKYEKLGDDAYLRTCNVGAVLAQSMYRVYKINESEYELNDDEKFAFERVTKLFYDTKTFLDGWLKMTGKEDGGDYSNASTNAINKEYHYELTNNFIAICLNTVEAKANLGYYFKDYRTNIFVFDKACYTTYNAMMALRENRDESAFM